LSQAQKNYIKKLKKQNENKILNGYLKRIEVTKTMAYEEKWNINGVDYTRQAIMKKIIEWVSDGNPLKMFCDQPGAPSIGKVYYWFKNYPEFHDDFRAAEEAGGHSLGDRALMTAMYVTSPEEVPAAKLKYDAMVRRAAQMNQRFQDKQVFRAETDVKTLSESELNERRNLLLEKIKGELSQQGWKPPEEMEILEENNASDETV
jgi:hypothetical protein